MTINVVFIVNMHIIMDIHHRRKKKADSKKYILFDSPLPPCVSLRIFYIYFLQHAIVTIILDNVVLIKNFIFFRVEDQAEFVFNANIIQLVDIVVIAKKHFIVIQIYQ